VYQPHPSAELNALFQHRPFQGADPEQSRFLFVGLDANYDANLELSSSYRSVLEYHADGVAFWRRHGVHHPFLLPTYRGDGRRYHLNFAKIGFTPDEADQVSFIELLHVPTVGRNKLVAGDLVPLHLARINSLVTAGNTRHVFLSAGVACLMTATTRFQWLTTPKPSSGDLPILYSVGRTRVYLHLHFSNYGKFQAQLEREAQAIARLINTETANFALDRSRDSVASRAQQG
jgi:hypothetical protein